MPDEEEVEAERGQMLLPAQPGASVSIALTMIVSTQLHDDLELGCQLSVYSLSYIDQTLSKRTDTTKS